MHSLIVMPFLLCTLIPLFIIPKIFAGPLCSTCPIVSDEYNQKATPEVLHAARLVMEQTKLLGLLKIDGRPHITRNKSLPLPKFMHDGDAHDDSHLHDKIPPKEYFIPLKEIVCPNMDTKSAVCLELNVSKNLLPDSIRDATLHLHLIGDSDISELHISELTNEGDKHLLIDQGAHSSTQEWININVSSLIASWLKRDNNLVKLKLWVEGEWLMDVDGLSGPWLHMVMGLSPARGKRDKVCSSSTTSCCLHRFYVNFTEILWNDWILQPVGYYANYCAGDCRSHSTKIHPSVLRAAGSHGEYVNETLTPCCSPTHTKPLTLLYMLSDGYVRRKTIPGMQVVTCAC